MGTNEPREKRLELLPPALLATIMTKLDVGSICCAASTCTAFRTCASQILSFLPTFHLLDIAPSVDLLRPLLQPPNPYLKSLKIDCDRLNDSAIKLLLRPPLHELCLHNCAGFSGKLLSEIGRRCPDLRSLCLGSVAEKRGQTIDISDLKDLLCGCTQLEALILMFDVSFDAQVWALASEKLTYLEIDYIPSETVIEMVSPNLGPHQSPNHVRPSILSNIQKLCLSVDHITDTMVGTISRGLVSLTHLDLSDAPLTEPEIALDLTNYGLQQLNQYGKLRRLSLVRRQEFIVTYFRRVNDLGVLFMADKCAKMESICLGGFCRVTDTGFKTILHSCSRLHKLQVSLGTQLTDLVFHDISATSLSLIHVSLIFCNLLTNRAVMNLVSNKDLRILDLRNCKNLGDEALRAISTLPQLKTLLLDGSDISDVGLTYLRPGVIGSLVRLSIRGCRRLTDKCISALFDGSCRMKLRELDLSNIPNLSDYGILLLARSRVPFSELRMQFCPLVGDTAVMALASMQVYEDRWHGSSLRLLDLYECGGITQLAFRWLKKPYFPRLRWLGVRGSVNRDLVDALARNRPYLHVECHGGKLGANRWDCSDGSHVLDYDEAYDYEEVDELEQWLLEGEIEHDDEEMGDAENNAEPME
ncbi:hypothetical protein F2P56_029526 [Juglans regia]|uniref:F-box/LRR-repeat protein 10 n=2 Tax=Juglans regia TaxID=51240 RepID=A0A833U2S2_JUGRE|nr:F-box/LRR-repeat protein 10-like [Juglans regia]KAF5449038.1 hypothetical protein F2P56_029526 [Juglans regia]